MTLSNAPSAAIVRATGVSLQPTPLSPAPGLISWWRAENNALDTIGTNNGVLTNGTTFAAGKVGQGFLFDGINDYVVVPDSASLRPASVTLEAWVKIASSSGIMLVFAKPIGSGTLDSYGLAIQDGVPLGAISDANGFGPFLYSTYPMATNQWYHLAYSLDGNTLQEVLYVNGATVAAANAGRSIGYDAHPMLIGADIENGVPSFSINGQIDEATIYNRALDANEIASIYNVGAAGKQLPSVSQPLLRIEEITPTGVRLSWSASSPNYHLVYSTNLATTNWTTSALTPVITGTNYVITNSLLQSAQQFYRLSNP
jgi:hypothetical protein